MSKAVKQMNEEDKAIRVAVITCMPFVGFLSSLRTLTRAQFEHCFESLPENLQLSSRHILKSTEEGKKISCVDMYESRHLLYLAYLTYYPERKFSDITDDVFRIILTREDKDRLGRLEPFNSMCKIFCDALGVPLAHLQMFPAKPAKPVPRGSYLAHPFVKKAAGSVFSSLALLTTNLCSSVGPLVLKHLAPHSLVVLFPVLLLLTAYFVFTRGFLGRAFVLTFMPLVVEYASEAFYFQLPKLAVVGVGLLLNCVGHWLVEQDKRALLKVLALMAGVFPELLLVNGQLDRVHFEDVKKDASPLLMRHALYANGNVLLLGDVDGALCVGTYKDKDYGVRKVGHAMDGVYLACDESNFMRLHAQLCEVSQHLAFEAEGETQKTTIKTSRLVHMLGEVKGVFDYFGMGAYYQEIEDSLSVFLRV